MDQISSKQFRILAVAPSTRGFGFVVMEGEKTILKCATRVAHGNEKEKNAQSITKLEKLLDSYQPHVVVLQDMEAKGSRRAPRIKTLNRQIKAVAVKRNIQVKLISGTQMRSVLLGDPKGTKQEMAEMLAVRFPDALASRLPQKRKAWDSEDDRMDIFDAVALAVMFRTYYAGRK
jgi:Holliday junction resolvasome RuvABC endonuclease subunit